MRKSWLWFGLLLFALLAGCGQQGAPGGGGGGSGSLTTAQALEAYAAVQSRFVAPLAATGFGGIAPVPAFIPYLNALDPYSNELPFADCQVNVAGSLADADHDLVPEGATFNGSCSWQVTVEGKTITLTWTFSNFRIEDPNDHNPNAGYRASGDMSWRLQVTGELDQTVELSISHHDLVWDAHQGLYTYDYTGTLTWRDEDNNEHRDAYRLTGTWKPEDTNDPWLYGWQTIDEESKFEDQEKESGSWVTKHELDLWTISALHFVERGIESGELVAKFIDKTTDPEQTCTVTFTWDNYGVTPTPGDDCRD